MVINRKEDIFNIEIDAPLREVFQSTKEAFNKIAKPLDGLGDFETLICQIAAVQRNSNVQVKKRAAVIMCADNGIVEEGVSQSGKEITLSVAKALGQGISTACTLGRSSSVTVFPVDIGIDSDEKIEGVRDLKVSKGTKNFAREPAMSDEEVCRAIGYGAELVKELTGLGYNMIAMGEMGIGNTTTSTAVLSAVLGIDSDIVTGRGAGLDEHGLEIKKRIIKEALKSYDFDSIEDKKDRAFEILRCVGGLDMAGLVGVCIGGALCHVPVVIDGLISSASAVIADILVPGVRDYLIASHKGRESGNIRALEHLGLTPFIDGNMALGEGTGAIMLFPLIDIVADFYRNAAGFSDYNIDEYKRLS